VESEIKTSRAGTRERWGSEGEKDSGREKERGRLS